MRTPTPPSNPNEIPLVDRLRAATAGKYTIGAELGAGGMATVFRATEIALEREVAIKVMSMEVASTPGAVERFRREARVAAALSHPHIVPIYAIGEDPKLAFFAMKFIEGRGLDSILKKEPVQPIDAVIRTIATVGRALAHAHEKGVVHRDVKPANVMVGNDGWIYVTDFGIAKRDDAQGLTQAGTVIGTPAYMSPEQFNGMVITGAADQYSLGIVAYEMLAGRAPFNGPSLGEIMRGHLLEPPPPIRTIRVDVPTGVVDVVNRMLDKDAAKRFPTLADAAAALEDAGSGARGGARRPAAAGTSSAAPQSPLSVMVAATTSPTTPIPRNNPTPPPRNTATPVPTNAAADPATTTGSARRTGVQPRPPVKQSGGGLRTALLIVGALLLGSWFVFQERIDALLNPPPTVAGAPAAAPSAAPPAAPVPDGPSDDAGAVSAPDDSNAPKDTADAVDVNAAIADLAARISAAPTMDVVAPADSVVVRIGSQTQQTVLFVNDRQIGILGGVGLVSVTVPPGAVTLSVRKLNCQNWDTTFTPVTGRRYTFVERSPRC